ncbi:Flp pilus assembly protein, ATPase CpaE [Sulfitobacter brevis]|uniref:Flp pilus assembly protein, ATPase CpaE n=1 Tax=Sulfitobacter brevis TaxID=74348 RepID=A0A1I1XWV8_9RHOB|nr:AAA family ATPase [Sulfitobacter brevis]SFE11188.1 Flp pilus assembly protein, ATPase CpaE [Sulfitobacter brevis]
MTLAHHDIEKQVASAITPATQAPAPARTKVLIVTQDPAMAQMLQSEMASDASVTGRIHSGALASVVDVLASANHVPNVLVFQLSEDDNAALSAIRARHPGMQIVAITPTDLPDADQAALRAAGVQEVLVMKVASEAPVAEDLEEAPIAAAEIEKIVEPDEPNIDTDLDLDPEANFEDDLNAGGEEENEALATVEPELAETSEAVEAEAPALSKPAKLPMPKPTPPLAPAAMGIPAPAATPRTPRPHHEQGPAPLSAATRPASAGGDITVLLRARGGAGATTLAVNLAVAQAKRSGEGKTALVDLDIQNGAVALLLDLPDSAEATRFLRGETATDGTFLDTAMVRHSSGVDVLTAPDVFGPLTSIRPEMVASLIDALKARYDHVILDMPQAVVDWMEPVLSKASRLLVVSDMSLLAIRRTRRLIDLIAEEHMTLPLHVVMNFQKKPVLSSAAQKEATQLIGRPLSYWIPADPKAARRASDTGAPMVLQSKRAAASKAISALGKVIFANKTKG